MTDTELGINSEATNISSSSGEDFYIVGVGASAGGLAALEDLFANMPIDTGMAFVVIQHLSPDFKSLMCELLARHTQMKIHRVENHMVIEPNRIYLIPARRNMVVSEGRLLLTEQDPAGGLNLPIDIFFRSLAQDVGKRAIGIVLSGTGSDGSRGIEDIHAAGGLILAQDAESAGFDGMPRNAIATGKVNVVATPEEIHERLAVYAADPVNFPRKELEVEIPLIPGSELSAIFRLLRGRYGIDFTLYRENTIHRRIDRRMQLSDSPKLSDYVRRLVDDHQELDALYRDLLVEVTQFFRDPQAFARLNEDVIPQIIDSASGASDEIRVWVPACATGEEAYTVAMLLDNYEPRDGAQKPSIRVFATDVHRNSLEIASSGVYSSDAMTSVPPNLKEKYFTHHSSLYHVNRELRQMVIFAPHDITKDPPFTRVDLISCRNVLIYFEPVVQRRVLSLFHFGLKVGGMMLLGPSESVGELSNEFDTVDQHWRIFQKLRDVRLPETSTMRLASPLFDVVKSRAPLPGNSNTKNSDYVERTVLEDLLDKYVPPSFLVNPHFELVHSFGDARRLLVQPKGRPTLELLKMVEGDLRMAMSAALHRAVREKEQVVLDGIRIESESSAKLVRVCAEPYKKRNQDLYLISIQEMADVAPATDFAAATFDADDQSAQRILDLERELEFNKESLQTSVEELESSNEELQSTNEELVASNEELQSTNEELHSVNEELYTVNAEHQRKIAELSQLTSDMDNLMRSTDIGTIFLDRDLCIRRFTPAIASAFNVLEQDIGRPIDQFAYHFESPGWLEDAKNVMQTGEAHEVDLRARNSDTVYLKRTRPYQNTEGATSGVVITFTDVTAVAHAQEERKQRKQLERITRDLQGFAYAVSHDLEAPARQIDSCLARLRELVADDSDEQLRGLLDATSTRTERLREMLESLLEYSRINTRGQAFESVNLDSLLNQLTQEFSSQIETTGAVVTSDALPTLCLDPVQIHKCLWHLLDNALKFNGDEPPAIHIGATESESEWQLSVRDNGIGIQQKSLENVFLMFRKLGFKDAGGIGVGLALCRRIIERHQGDIWAESSSHGTTIYMRLPSQPKLKSFAISN